MNAVTLATLALLLNTILTAKQSPLPQPTPTIFKDRPQDISLAKDESLTLPFATRTISYRLETDPKDGQGCTFTEQSLLYRPLETSSLFTATDDAIGAILPLPRLEKVFLVDEKHNLGSYSIDQHSLLKKLSPGRAMVSPDKKHIGTIELVATPDEKYIYYLTPSYYKVFKTESLGLQVLLQGQLQGEMVDIQKATIHKGYLIILSRQSGIKIYNIGSDKKLTLLQIIKHQSQQTLYADYQLQTSSQLLYLLCLNRPIILTYHFKPSQFPNSDKTITIFQSTDQINLIKVTNKHSGIDQSNLHLDLAITTSRQQQTIMVLFMHSYHFVIAQIYYNPFTMDWSFIRYFKFATAVNSIHVSGDALIVVATNTIGVFPIGIHPALIEEEINGKMALSSILQLTVLPNGHVIGITPDSIEYAAIQLNQDAKLNCQLSHPSQLRYLPLTQECEVVCQLNCMLNSRPQSIRKEFVIEEMKLAVSAPVADTLSSGLLVLLVVIIAGICLLFVMQQRKERQIRQLQVFFEERRRHQQATDRQNLSQ